MSAADAFVVALADGQEPIEAAARLGLRSSEAAAEMKACSWPDMDAVRAYASEITARLSREETPMPPRAPRQRREPVPLEPDVAAAINPSALPTPPTVSRDQVSGFTPDAFDVARAAVKSAVEMSQADVTLAPPTPMPPEEVESELRKASDRLISSITAGTIDHEQHPAATHRATLTMPLGHLIDADGRKTIIGMAHIDIELVPALVVDWLSADPSTDAPPVRVANARRELTPEGVEAIRQLAALLPADGPA